VVADEVAEEVGGEEVRTSGAKEGGEVAEREVGDVMLEATTADLCVA
jgi:hypothetical protein